MNEKYDFTHTFIVFPQDLNPSFGTLYGGKLLAEMDTCAGTLSKRISYQSDCDGFVTAKVESVLFKKPAYLGDIITLKGRLVELHETEAKVHIEALKEIANGPEAGSLVTIGEGSFLMVSIKYGKRYPHGK